MQLQELYILGKQKLRDNSIDTPGLEAYLLLSKLDLVSDISDVYSHPEKKIEKDGLERFKMLLERRVRREPAAYILGQKEFYSKTFKVNSSVLIPRAETELLVDETVQIINQTASNSILEIGTGSGCLAITIASICKDVRIVATDISKEAILLAKENSCTHDQSSKISFLRGDLLESLKNSSFDIVVSNPPYIKDEDYLDLEPEVRDYEPTCALIAGRDGLYHIEKIISDSTRVLRDGGSCILEIGYGQVEAVVRIFKEFGFEDISYSKDLNGIERVVKAKWKK